MTRTKAAIIAVLALAGGLAGAATPRPAQADDAPVTVDNFLKLCSAPEHRDSCADSLAEYLLVSQAPCVPSLDQVLAEMRRHPEWSKLSWTAGVDAAGKALCSK